MTTASLFGVVLAPLFAAIAEVESENGKTSNNVYQISGRYLADVNRIRAVRTLHRLNKFNTHDRFDRTESERMMWEYLNYYGYRYRMSTGKNPTAEVFARIHNGGPNGWRKESTLKYWHKVKAVMDAAEKEGETKCK